MLWFPGSRPIPTLGFHESVTALSLFQSLVMFKLTHMVTVLTSEAPTGLFSSPSATSTHSAWMNSFPLAYLRTVFYSVERRHCFVFLQRSAPQLRRNPCLCEVGPCFTPSWGFMLLCHGFQPRNHLLLVTSLGPAILPQFGNVTLVPQADISYSHFPLLKAWLLYQP